MTRDTRRPPHPPRFPYRPSDWRDDQASRLRGLTANIALAGVAATAGIALGVGVTNTASAAPTDSSIDQAAPVTGTDPSSNGTPADPGTLNNPGTVTDPGTQSGDQGSQVQPQQPSQIQVPTVGRHRHATSGGS
jgi:hypothetical protein